ncbi:adhesion G-protein coupled receptor G7-like isoform X2 [Carassius auratus]|uniref:Adhesion G-protein coupled receptor G7-like isoform X2 n=1 Tax=Carassius auratus TaxID=7957 RepID=A0A6P6M5T6_CARAU|nr:adhesion G-protein coupled receptor G7-like isoform X2 [Carassius auratus]
MNVISNTCEMDYSLLLLICTSAVFEKTWCQYTPESTTFNTFQYTSESTTSNGFQYTSESTTPNTFPYTSESTTPNAIQYTSGSTNPNTFQYTSESTTPNAFPYTSGSTTSNGFQYTSESTTPNAFPYTSESTTPNAIQYTSESTNPNTFQYTSESTTPNTLQYTSESTTSNTLQYTSESTTSNTFQYSSESTTPNTFQYTSESTTPNTFQYISESTTPNTLQYTSESTTPNTLQYTSESTTPNTFQYTSESTTPNTFQYTSESTTPNTFQYTSESTTPNTFQYTSESTTPNTFQYTSESTTPNTLQYTSESSTPNTLQYTSESTTPNTLQYTSESTTPNTSQYPSESTTFNTSQFTSESTTNTSNSSISTTIRPLSTTMTVPSLLCENKGILQDGICICPDDWTGTTCNIPNFCPEQKPTPTSKFHFLKTVLGQFASSVERCPPETTNAGIPQASSLCNISTHSFNPPNILSCSLTLDAINEGIPGATPEEKKNLASSTQILTSIPERLTPLNITNAAQITNTLLSDQQTTETTDIAISAVATISQLLNASREMYSSVDHTAISELTQTLQKLSLREEQNPLLVQPKMAVQSLKGQKPIRQVQLTFFKGLSDNFLPDRIKLQVTEAEYSKHTVDLQMNVRFSEDFNKDIGFVLYDNDQFFQSKSFQPSLDTKRRVISANLQENSGIDQVQFAVTPSADSTMSLSDFACVSWSYSKKDWITDGCTKTESPLGHAVCSCKKLKNANFAILMAFDINYQYSEALNWISITGCALSVLGLSVTALYQIKTRKSRRGSPTLLVVNICLSMMAFYLLFIFGINNPVQHVNEPKISGENIVPKSDHHKYTDQGPCTTFTALLQYFLLATFTWNTLYGINVFLLFRNSVSGTPPWFPWVAMAVGWGLPAVIVGISLGSTYSVEEPLGYRQEEFCWLASLDHKKKFSIKKPMFWGFVLPLLLMLISSTAIQLHFSYNICRTNPNLNKSLKTPLKKKMLSSFSLAVMLGLSWVTGYILMIAQEKNLKFILSVVFCLLNTTQGVQIFILFTLRPFLNSNPGVLNSLHAPEIGLHKKTFFLWKNKTPESNESYKSTDLDSI